MARLSQHDLQRMTGIHQTTISRIEAGLVPGTPAQRRRLAKIFSIDIDEADLFAQPEGKRK